MVRTPQLRQEHRGELGTDEAGDTARLRLELQNPAWAEALRVGQLDDKQMATVEAALQRFLANYASANAAANGADTNPELLEKMLQRPVAFFKQKIESARREKNDWKRYYLRIHKLLHEFETRLSFGEFDGFMAIAKDEGAGTKSLRIQINRAALNTVAVESGKFGISQQATEILQVFVFAALMENAVTDFEPKQYLVATRFVDKLIQKKADTALDNATALRQGLAAGLGRLNADDPELKERDDLFRILLRQFPSIPADVTFQGTFFLQDGQLRLEAEGLDHLGHTATGFWDGSVPVVGAARATPAFAPGRTTIVDRAVAPSISRSLLQSLDGDRDAPARTAAEADWNKAAAIMAHFLGSTDQPNLYGKYKVTRDDFLGKGAFGSVWRALDTNMHRYVAIKIFHRDPNISEDQYNRHVAQLEEEVRILRNLEHRRIPTVPAIYDQKGILRKEGKGEGLLVMSLAPGRKIESLVKGLDPSEFGQAFTADAQDMLLAVATGLLQALQSAHEEKVVHRDIKPDNIMAAMHQGKVQLTLLDWGLALRLIPTKSEVTSEFGLATESSGTADTIYTTLVEMLTRVIDRANEKDELNCFGQRLLQMDVNEADRARIVERAEAVAERIMVGSAVMGSIGFIAPETILNPGHVWNGQEDIYAVGALLYYLMTGVVPTLEPDQESHRKRQGSLMAALRRAARHEYNKPSRYNPAFRDGAGQDVRRIMDDGNHGIGQALQYIILKAMAPPEGERLPANAKMRAVTLKNGKLKLLTRYRDAAEMLADLAAYASQEPLPSAKATRDGDSPDDMAHYHVDIVVAAREKGEGGARADLAVAPHGSSNVFISVPDGVDTGDAVHSRTEVLVYPEDECHDESAVGTLVADTTIELETRRDRSHAKGSLTFGKSRREAVARDQAEARRAKTRGRRRFLLSGAAVGAGVMGTGLVAYWFRPVPPELKLTLADGVSHVPIPEGAEQVDVPLLVDGESRVVRASAPSLRELNYGQQGEITVSVRGPRGGQASILVPVRRVRRLPVVTGISENVFTRTFETVDVHLVLDGKPVTVQVPLEGRIPQKQDGVYKIQFRVDHDGKVTDRGVVSKALETQVTIDTEPYKWPDNYFLHIEGFTEPDTGPYKGTIVPLRRLQEEGELPPGSDISFLALYDQGRHEANEDGDGKPTFSYFRRTATGEGRPNAKVSWLRVNHYVPVTEDLHVEMSAEVYIAPSREGGSPGWRGSGNVLLGLWDPDTKKIGPWLNFNGQLNKIFIADTLPFDFEGSVLSSDVRASAQKGRREVPISLPTGRWTAMRLIKPAKDERFDAETVGREIFPHVFDGKTGVLLIDGKVVPAGSNGGYVFPFAQGTRLMPSMYVSGDFDGARFGNLRVDVTQLSSPEDHSLPEI